MFPVLFNIYPARRPILDGLLCLVLEVLSRFPVPSDIFLPFSGKPGIDRELPDGV
jgi:hypothetical protein